jgi:hypothetical protein
MNIKKGIRIKTWKTLMPQPRTREFTEVLEGIKKRGLTEQETEKGRLWEQRATAEFTSTGLYKM